MDKLGGKLPLISIALVVLLQLGGAIAYMTNISRDIESNNNAIESIFNNPIVNDLDQFRDELYITRQDLEQIKQFVEQYSFIISDVVILQARVDSMDGSGQELTDAIRRLNNIEGSIQFLRDDQSIEEVGSKLDWLESNVIRNESQVQNNSQDLDQLKWELDDIFKRIVYMEESRGFR
tara:strand:+ start:78 stop:611 length:534 start_codon:yes stop_codon:yes gene_type:complete